MGRLSEGNHITHSNTHIDNEYPQQTVQSIDANINVNANHHMFTHTCIADHHALERYSIEFIVHLVFKCDFFFFQSCVSCVCVCGLVLCCVVVMKILKKTTDRRQVTRRVNREIKSESGRGFFIVQNDDAVNTPNLDESLYFSRQEWR